MPLKKNLFLKCLIACWISVCLGENIQDQQFYNETIPLILSEQSSIHIVQHHFWLVFDEKQKMLLDERYCFHARERVRPKQINIVKPKETVVVNSDLIVIWCLNQYYHFLIETLPTIYSLYINSIFGLYPNSTILFTDDLPHKTAINIMSVLKIDLKTTKYILANQGTKYVTGKNHKLIIPTKSRLLSPPYGPIHDTKMYLIQSLGNRVPYVKYPVDQVYISRLGYRRNALNESALLFILQKHIKLKVIYHIESLTISDQIALFSNASLIIAPHGAALTNMIFCNKKEVAIVELSGKSHTGNFNNDAFSLGLRKHVAIWTNNTGDQLDLIFNPDEVADTIFMYLKSVNHTIHIL
jgi:capsular polysaccharide biosynthesis protein